MKNIHHIRTSVLLMGLLLIFMITYNTNAQPTSNIALYMGYANYHAANPVSTQKVILWNQDPVPVGSCWTNTIGYAYFNALTAAEPYTVEVVQNSKPWGGGNATDAMLCMRYFVQLPPTLTWDNRRIIIADVNGDAKINAVDPLIIARRWVGITNDFPVGSWYVDDTLGDNPPTVYAPNSQSATNTYYLSEICYGDVNYDYVPPVPRLEPSIRLNTSGIKYVKSGASFDLPIVTLDSLMLGSMSLILNFPEDDYLLTDVNLPNTCDSCQVYHLRKNILKIAWWNTEGVSKQAFDTLVLLSLRPRDSSLFYELKGISINGHSIITDTVGTEFTDIQLLKPKVVFINNSGKVELNIAPNPVSNLIHCTYTIPAEGRVSLALFDSFGNKVAQLADSRQVPGSYQFSYDGSDLPNGIYSLCLFYDNKVLCKKMVIMH